MTNEQFSNKIKSMFRFFHLCITIVLLCLLMYEYVTIASNKDVRVFDIKTPLFSTQFLQAK